jgi:ABC-type transporter MlaC component
MSTLRVIAALVIVLFAAAAGAADDATSVARRATEQLQAEIGAHRAEYTADHEALYARARQLLLPVLNVGLSAELALGKRWRRASHAEQAAMRASMEQALVRIYALALLDEEVDRRLDWKQSQMQALDGTTAVSATEAGEWPAQALLLFAMRRSVDGWQIYDVSFKGSSVIDGLRRRTQAAS